MQILVTENEGKKGKICIFERKTALYAGAMDEITRLLVGTKEESILRDTIENRTLAGHNKPCIDAIVELIESTERCLRGKTNIPSEIVRRDA